MLIGGAVIGFFGKCKNRMILVFLAYAVIGVTISLSGLLSAAYKGLIYFVLLNAVAGIGALICGGINFLIPSARNYDKELQK